jgi:serine---pyruvate transaminase
LAEKRYLFTPGPTPVPPEVLAALAEPVVHHRGSDYRETFRQCLERLGQVCRTASPVLVFTCSGTGAMESAVANLCSPGDRVVVVSAGAFGERWRRLTEAYGADVQAVEYEWGETPRAEDLSARLDEVGGAKAVFLTHSETSTGVVCDLPSLTAAAKAAGALVVVDAVSSLGAVRLEPDEWGIDVVASGSQKALMTPPGLGLVTVSEAALGALGTSPRFYYDWERTRTGQAKLDSAFTPAVSLVRALNVALGLLLDEGLENAFDRHVRLGRACREGAKAMGLELFSPDEDRSAVVTGMLTPEGIDAGELRQRLRDEYGITVAGGHGDLKNRLFRIGHIGYYDVFDITTALAAIELLLTKMGADVGRGVAVTAALDAFAAPVRV